MSDTSPGIEAKHYLLNQGVQTVYVWTSGEILQGSLEQNYTLKAECLCFPQKGFDSLWHCVVLQNNFYGLSYLVLYLVLKLFDITIRTPKWFQDCCRASLRTWQSESLKVQVVTALPQARWEYHIVDSSVAAPGLFLNPWTSHLFSMGLHNVTATER